MSLRRKADGSLKLHRQKPREDNLATGCLFSLHNVENRDIMNVGVVL